MKLRQLMLVSVFAVVMICDHNAMAAASDFDEGTETELSLRQLQEIRPWAINSLIQLRDLLDKANTMSYFDARNAMVDEIKNVVLASAPKKTELLMRFVLNRAMKVNDILCSGGDATVPGVLDAEVRVLRFSVEMAERYYTSDIAFLEGREKANPTASLPYAAFGLDYASLLMNLDKSMFQASAQYAVSRMALGLLQVDLTRDEQLRFKYAPAIGKIHSFLANLPAQSPEDSATALKYLRQMRKTYEQAIALINAAGEK